MSKEKNVFIKDIMTQEVMSVTPDTSIIDASQMMVENGFNGLPVVDDNRKVIGIVTEYDFITKGASIHLPTFIKIFSDFPDGERGKYLVQGKLADALSFKVREVMNPEPLVLKEGSTLEEVVRTFSEHHRVNPIPVVDSEGKLVGVVSRFDVIKFYAEVLRKAKNAL